jgi:hypothetical protein
VAFDLRLRLDTTNCLSPRFQDMSSLVSHAPTSCAPGGGDRSSSMDVMVCDPVRFQVCAGGWGTRDSAGSNITTGAPMGNAMPRIGAAPTLARTLSSAEDGAGWLAFFRDLVARGLSRGALVTSDAHPGLVAAIGATLPGAAWQRCRTHYTTNLMSVTPKSSWPWVRTLLHSIFDQPDA